MITDKDIKLKWRSKDEDRIKNHSKHNLKLVSNKKIQKKTLELVNQTAKRFVIDRIVDKANYMTWHFVVACSTSLFIPLPIDWRIIINTQCELYYRITENETPLPCKPKFIIQSMLIKKSRSCINNEINMIGQFRDQSWKYYWPIMMTVCNFADFKLRFDQYEPKL